MRDDHVVSVTDKGITKTHKDSSAVAINYVLSLTVSCRERSNRDIFYTPLEVTTEAITVRFA